MNKANNEGQSIHTLFSHTHIYTIFIPFTHICTYCLTTYHHFAHVGMTVVDMA